MSDKKVVEFKKGTVSAESTAVLETEGHFEELLDVVMDLRNILDYYNPADMKRSHSGPCSKDTPCDEKCKAVADMQIANSLLSRLDRVMGKLNLTA